MSMRVKYLIRVLEKKEFLEYNAVTPEEAAYMAIDDGYTIVSVSTIGGTVIDCTPMSAERGET